jgi:hypothetical protein
MKKIIKNIVGSFMLIITITVTFSCKKLDVAPISSITTSNYGTSAVQIEAQYAGAMDFLWGKYYGYGVGGDRTPELTFVNDDQLRGGDLQVPENQADPFWLMHYQAINNLNGALLAIKSGRVVGETAETVKALEAEGKFIRAHNYFLLVRLFGAVPLITEDTPDPANNLMARTPIAEVYALIVSDLSFAAANLPPVWPGAPGKPTSGAAKSILAKVYLTMATYPLNDPSNYQKAADMAQEVITSHTYTLTHGCENVFLPSNTYSSEMIWGYNSASVVDKASSARAWAPGEWLDGGWDGSVADTAFEHHWPAQPRKNAYLMLTLDGKPTGAPYTTAFAQQAPFCKKFFYYLNPSDFTSNNCYNNFPIIRYADVLLIYAEAANQAAGVPTLAACDAVNQIIDRANGYELNSKHPLMKTTMSKQAFDDAVIQERSWELCFEFPDRWFDICRKRILDKVTAPYPQYLVNYSPDDYLFAIPQNDLKLNSLLIQNPGYPTP